VTTVLERLPRGARVAIIRLRSLGDCVLTTPAVEILKQSRPDLRIGVVVEPVFAPVFEGNPAIGAILAPETKALRSFGPSLSLNLHGGTRSAGLTALSGAKLRAGFAHFRYQRSYNINIPRAQEILGVDRVVHTAEHLASAMFYLGARRVEIPGARLFAADRDSPYSQPYAVIHPFASQPDKTWPVDRFLALAGRLREQFDLLPTFIGGPGDDLSPFRQYATESGRALDSVKTLLRHAALFVGNDSGPAHMAAALGLPVAVLFGSSDVRIWRPWRAAGEALTNPAGIAAIPVETVLDTLNRLRVAA
jgi:lipopolysaccharide heptosyltransferase III